MSATATARARRSWLVLDCTGIPAVRDQVERAIALSAFNRGAVVAMPWSEAAEDIMEREAQDARDLDGDGLTICATVYTGTTLTGGRAWSVVLDTSRAALEAAVIDKRESVYEHLKEYDPAQLVAGGAAGQRLDRVLVEWIRARWNAGDEWTRSIWKVCP